MGLIRIGLILKPQGISGEVKAKPLTDDPSRFKKLAEAIIEKGGAAKPYAVSGVSIRNGYVFIRLEGVCSRNDAEALRGAYIATARENAVELPPDTYFIDELIGCGVYLASGRRLGEVIEVIRTGANDVYSVRTEKGALLIPAIKKVIKGINTAAKRIEVDAAALEEVALLED
ncbi:MAG: ribosome maturation factor RimM [Bacillota bacterium]|nr:ribosome maturation factor RimM [Bacillota bacterium]